MKMKKIVILVASMATLVAVSVGGTLAYLTDKKEVNNLFTIGDVKIGIVEDTWKDTVSKDIEPGATVAKDPKVENTGKNAAYIRVKVEIPTFAVGDKTKDLYTLNDIDNDWSKEADGYYYFNAIVKPNGATSELFQSVTLSTEFKEDSSINGENQINVIAEAVQTTGLGDDVNTAQEAFAVGYSN